MKCVGGNDCKGKGACGSATTSCAGTNECKGKGWILVTEKECKDKGNCTALRLQATGYRLQVGERLVRFTRSLWRRE